VIFLGRGAISAFLSSDFAIKALKELAHWRRQGVIFWLRAKALQSSSQHKLALRGVLCTTANREK